MRSPPPVASRSTTSGKNKWGPYSNSKDFYTNTAIVLLILISAAILAFLLHAALRFYLRWRRRRCLPNSSAETQKPTKEDATVAVVETLPEMLYSPATNLAGGEAECAICLTEFAGGDRVRVLPACRHGFHVRCVDEWIAGRPSCPTCRAACRSAAGSPERRPEVA